MESLETRPQLRSLHVGEIFDRATTMYVRHFVVFSLIVFTLLAPLAILRFIALGANSDDYTQLMNEMLHPGAAAAAVSHSLLTLSIGLALLTFVLAPIVNNAVASGVAALYDGQPLDYRASFARVLRRLAPLLGTMLLCLLVLIAAYVGLVLTGAVMAMIAAATYALSGIVGIAFIVVAVLAGFGLLALFALVALTCALALYATTIERQAPGQALRQAFGRIFNRRELPKALLVVLAYIALEIVAVLVTGSVGALILLYLHSALLEIVFSTVAGALLNAYVTILLAVYYFDVRTRAEGLDLEVDLDRLPGSV